jgi:hypothetical protein
MHSIVYARARMHVHACSRARARAPSTGRVQLSELCRAKEKALGAKSVGASAPYCTVR